MLARWSLKSRKLFPLSNGRPQFHTLNSLAAPEHPLVILSPREARIVPKKRTALKQSSKPVSNEYIHAPRASNSDRSSESIINAIDDLKPRTQPTSPRTLKETISKLESGFTHANLKQFIIAKNMKPSKMYKFKKTNSIQYIVNNVWGVKTSSKIDDFVENRISLSPKDFVLTLGDSGFLLREFSKSGAQISLWPAKHQILVLSSAGTFKWIQSRLTLFLEKVHSVDFDLTPLQKLELSTTQIEDELRAIQQITDSYISILPEKLVIYTAGDARKHNSMNAVRLIYSLVEKALERKTNNSKYYTDAISANSECSLHPFDDRSAFEWYNKLYTWSRLETVKTKQNGRKNNFVDQEVCLQEFKMPKFTELNETSKSSLKTQLNEVVQKLVESPLSESLNGEQVSRTITSSFGYLLYKNNGELSPNAAMDRVFATTVPNVAKYAETLPFYDADVAEEEANNVNDIQGVETTIEETDESLMLDDAKVEVANEVANGDSKADTETNETNESSEKDLWDTWSNKVFTTRRKEQEFNMSTKYVSARYIPNPSLANAHEYPLVDAWIPVNEVSGSEVRLLALPKQQNTYVSLPSLPTDVQFTVIDSYSIPNTAEINAFFDVFKKSKMRYGLDQKLVLNFNGSEVEYVCSNAKSVSVSELQFNDQLLQLLNMSNEFHQKLETSIVSEDAEELVQTTVKFIKEVERNI